MDPLESGQGQDEPPEQSCFLTPSSKGRQRKKNPKYFDYETEDINSGPQQKTPRKTPGLRRGASQRNPVKSGRANDATQQTTGEEASDNTPQGASEQISGETPQKGVRGKTTPQKKTPGKRTARKQTSTSDGDVLTVEGAAVAAGRQENGTPKRKYVRKRPAPEVKPDTETPTKESQEEPPAEPEEDSAPGGRRRRGAAKMALKYLHSLAKEVLSDESGSQVESRAALTPTEGGQATDGSSLKRKKGRKGRKRRRVSDDDDPGEDEDFVPDREEEEVETEDEDEAEAENSDSDLSTGGKIAGTSHFSRRFRGCNGLTKNIMKPVWESAEMTKKFREEHHSSWVFPNWIPSTSDWHPVQQSDLEKYLPQERQSAAVKVSRTDLREEPTPLQRLSRFAAVPPHPDRWDMLLFAGGPVWAMEWCPMPDGVVASQYVALACHRGMDDHHCVNKTDAGPGLVQLWDVGRLECGSRPDSPPALAYCIAQDKGFIWHLKWCPAGGWEPPSSGRTAPFLPRLGLLAVSTSSGVVTIYSLPHPDALLSISTQDNSASQSLSVYQTEAVLTLKLGSFKAPRHEKSGQVLTLDWLPKKPHNIIAVGFYDGVVGLWDLSTQSALLRVREPDKSLSLTPYRCILAHDHAVRALAFCPASRHLLVTAGDDRLVKTWDLRRLSDPISVLKRFLTNEIYWPLNASGVMLAQENAYVPNGSQGVHYVDFNLRSFFAIPRAHTLWSISYSDWLNSVVTSDILGELILAILPQISVGYHYVKRALERRFPIYLTSLVPHGATEEDMEVVEEEEERDAVEEEGREAEGSGAGSEGGNEGFSGNEKGAEGSRVNTNLPPRLQTYREAVKKYYIHHRDNNMETFTKAEKREVWKHMKNTELTANINMDDMPLAALHKVRFSPNLCSHTWVVSGGQAGLVRLICLRGLLTSQAKTFLKRSQTQIDPRTPEEAAQRATDDASPASL
ncbi:general transcription factor 3C polypeptide 2 [Antennarius striatus]|uniref:general transcription factor 3C polypeptide 2 n=1 Tax=Antennarius striatus TaxID=241820 RepID=UPI0035B1AC83